MDQGRFGAHAEYLFAVKCLELGFDVSMPLRHTSPYDLILDTGDRLLKVQVKSSSQPPRGKHKSVNVLIYKSNNQLYEVGEIDYLALYVYEFQGFFIFKYDQPKMSYRVHPEGIYKKHFNNFAFDLRDCFSLFCERRCPNTGGAFFLPLFQKFLVWRI